MDSTKSRVEDGQQLAPGGLEKGRERIGRQNSDKTCLAPALFLRSLKETLTMMETHQRGVELFTRGQYQGAIGCFEACLQVAETSEVWNDWAAANSLRGAHRKQGRA